MQSVLGAVFGILGLLLAAHEIGPLYKMVKTETVLKVHRGLPPMEGFTHRLTR